MGGQFFFIFLIIVLGPVDPLELLHHVGDNIFLLL